MTHVKTGEWNKKSYTHEIEFSPSEIVKLLEGIDEDQAMDIVIEFICGNSARLEAARKAVSEE